MSDKHERVAEHLIDLANHCRDEQDETEQATAYLREQFPEPVKIEGVRELVKLVLDCKQHDYCNHHDAERIITDFIQTREAGK